MMSKTKVHINMFTTCALYSNNLKRNQIVIYRLYGHKKQNVKYILMS